VSQERSEAIVLRGVDFSETSRIVTFLTPQRGRMAGIAKGARRRKSPLGAVLDTFNRIELVYYWKDDRQVQTVADAALLDGFSPIKRNLEKSSFAAFPLEVAYKVGHENEPSGKLYATLVRGLEALTAWQGNVRTHVCWQVIHLLRVAGFEPGLDACIACGGPIPEAPGFSFEGGVTCGACRADVRLSAGEYDALCGLTRQRAQCPPLEDTARVFQVMSQYAVRHLETDLRSVRVIAQMFG